MDGHVPLHKRDDIPGVPAVRSLLMQPSGLEAAKRKTNWKIIYIFHIIILDLFKTLNPSRYYTIRHRVYLCVPCGSHNKQRLFP
jgi:hypothetical protein